MLDKQTSEVEVVAYPDLSSLPSHAPDADMVLKLNNTPIASNEPVLGRDDQQAAMKWKVVVPLTKVDNKIEISTGKTEEQGSTIYLSRQ